MHRNCNNNNAIIYLSEFTECEIHFDEKQFIWQSR